MSQASSERNSKPKILVQLDPDPQASVFDAVVAVDAGVDQLLQHPSVTLDDVTGLVHGAMFTRGPADLKHTAIFVGGSDVATGEAMLRQVTETFLGPIRVSVMMDASGANTTAAAAVVAAGRHLDLAATNALVLAATGPVGQRVTRLLGGAGARVQVASRSLHRAEQLVQRIREDVPGAKLTPIETSDLATLPAALEGIDLVIGAGAAGVQLLPAVIRTRSAVKVAIDLNAVPPVGLEGIDVLDKAKQQDGQICYGAIGVGGTKMNIHKAAIRRLFETNDVIMDVDAIYQLGMELESDAG